MTQTLSGPMMPAQSGTARQLMVLLHGYGADGQDLISLGYQWRELWPDMLFVAPNAPEICTQNPAGFQWFPLRTDRTIGRIEGVGNARPVVVNFLIDLWAQTGISPANTVLAGFSQGAMMALHVGTSLDQPVAGIVSFSGAFVPPPEFGSGKYAAGGADPRRYGRRRRSQPQPRGGNGAGRRWIRRDASYVARHRPRHRARRTRFRDVFPPGEHPRQSLKSLAF